MQKLLKFFFLQPKDIGMRKNEIQDVAHEVSTKKNDDESLIKFAKFVSSFLDDKNECLTSQINSDN